MRAFLFVVVVIAGAAASPAYSCAHDNPLVCVVSQLQKLDGANIVPLFDGISFIKTGDDRSARALSEAEIENELPQDASEKSSRLLDMIIDATLRFFKTHSLQFKLPETTATAIARTFEEGRGKMKKTILPLLIGGAAKVVISVVLAIAALFPISIKALLIAKLALAIVAVLGLQKVLGGSGGGAAGILGGKVGGTGSGGWSSGGGSYSNTGSGGWSTSAGGPYYRSFDDSQAQDLAYSGQAQSQS